MYVFSLSHRPPRCPGLRFLETVDIDKQHRGVDSVAVDSSDQALELAHEAAAVRQVDERVEVRQLVELLDSLLQPSDLGPQCTDLLDQPLAIFDVGDASQLVRHCP